MTYNEGQTDGNYLVPLILLVMFVGIAPLLAQPSYLKSRERTRRRCCYCNIKQISTAIELYEVETGQRVPRLDSKLLEKLHKKGLLETVPNDPGNGPNTSANYELIKGTVYCKYHGGITSDGLVKKYYVDNTSFFKGDNLPLLAFIASSLALCLEVLRVSYRWVSLIASGRVKFTLY